MRIHLRRFTTSDLAAFQAYRTDPELARFQGWAIESDPRALAFLTEMSQAPQLADGAWLQLAICRSDQDTVIGDIGLHYIGQQHSLEIGYTLNSNYHGKGIAQRAISLAILWMQTVHRYTDILAITDIRNVPSIRLLERLGFDQTTTETTDGVDEHHYRLAIRFRHNQID